MYSGPGYRVVEPRISRLMRPSTTAITSGIPAHQAGRQADRQAGCHARVGLCIVHNTPCSGPAIHLGPHTHGYAVTAIPATRPGQLSIIATGWFVTIHALSNP